MEQQFRLPNHLLYVVFAGYATIDEVVPHLWHELCKLTTKYATYILIQLLASVSYTGVFEIQHELSNYSQSRHMEMNVLLAVISGPDGLPNFWSWDSHCEWIGAFKAPKDISFFDLIRSTGWFHSRNMKLYVVNKIIRNSVEFTESAKIVDHFLMLKGWVCIVYVYKLNWLSSTIQYSSF